MNRLLTAFSPISSIEYAHIRHGVGFDILKIERGRLVPSNEPLPYEPPAEPQFDLTHNVLGVGTQKPKDDKEPK